MASVVRRLDHNSPAVLSLRAGDLALTPTAGLDHGINTGRNVPDARERREVAPVASEGGGGHNRLRAPE